MFDRLAASLNIAFEWLLMFDLDFILSLSQCQYEVKWHAHVQSRSVLRFAGQLFPLNFLEKEILPVLCFLPTSKHFATRYIQYFRFILLSKSLAFA